jgi:hypothetical protein
MKPLLMLCLLIPTFVFANETSSLPTVCITISDLAKTLDEYEELPLVRGTGNSLVDGSSFPVVVFANGKTGTFTITQRQSKDLYCILAVGTNFQPVPKEMQDTIKDSQQKDKL